MVNAETGITFAGRAPAFGSQSADSEVVHLPSASSAPPFDVVLNGQPGLVFFYSAVSGHCRRVEGFLAQVLQRRRNHGTFKLYRVEETERPDLVARFAVGSVPTLMVVQEKRVRAKLEQPRGCRDIERFLEPWLN